MLLKPLISGNIGNGGERKKVIEENSAKFLWNSRACTARIDCIKDA